ncbi:MAG: TonB-dependent receptor [Acidimicrobiia bacterium]|nr:TonB-dependent receptor [Acidimicrobiia bacterium]
MTIYSCRLAYLVLAIALCMSAQVPTGRIEGLIQDSSGALVPGAKLSLVNNRTQARIDSEANTEGFYIFPTLQPSTYTLTAEAPGFKTATVKDIELNVGITLSQVVTLEVGAVAESVIVESAAVRVQTTEATIQRSVTLRDIDTLPQLARNPIALAVFQPGIQINPGDPSFSRVNGQRQGANNNTLDGIDVNDSVLPRLGLALNATNTDSVEEFRIVTNGGKAEFGRNAGGQVELITRSGTNDFHGNLFEYHRNTLLNASNFFNNISGQARPKFIQNQFGGSLGGPVIIPKLLNGREKLFFFFNYQRIHTAQETVRNRTVLTPEAKAGVYRWRVPNSTEVRGFNILQNDPRRRGVDPMVAEPLNLLPLPNNFDVGDTFNTAGFRFNSPTPSQNNQITAKADYNLTSGHRVWYRHSRFRTYSWDALNSADPTYPGMPSGTQGGVRWGFAAGSNWTIRPWLVNEFVAGHQEASVDFVRVRPPVAVVVPNLYTAPIPSGTGSRRNSPVDQFTNNLSILGGRHSFKTGTRISRTTQFQSSDAGIWPNLNLSRNFGNVDSTIGPTGAATIATADRTRFENYYNDLTGRLSSISNTFYSDLQQFQPAGTPRVRNFKFNDYTFFFQDDWRVRPNLTLNLGLRYEFYGVPFERDGIQGTVVQAALIHPAGSLRDVTIQKGAQWFGNDWNNFAPRVGIAWDPRGNGKTSIRASWGIFYDRVIGATANDVDSAMPGFSFPGQVFPNQAANSDIRIGDRPAFPAPPSRPALTPDVTRTNTLAIFHPSFRTPYVMQMNFTVQHELFRSTVLEAGYVGNRGLKLLADLNMNQFKIGGQFLDDFNQLAAFRNGGRNNGPAVPASNVFVRMFGSVNAAITGAVANNLDLGAIGATAQIIDTNNFTRYPNAGLHDFYLRNFPQFGTLPLATNAGRSWYDSMQLSLRRQTGSVRFSLNYTWSKTIDTNSTDGSGFNQPIDSFHLRLSKGLADFDRRHSASWTGSYFLPFGRNRAIGGNIPGWLDRFVGGWELGLLGIWTSGPTMTVSSGVATTAANINSWADYSGPRNIGSAQRTGNGVIFFTPQHLAQFTVPVPGGIGSSGRNAFRGPRFFNIDTSIIKRFKIWEHHAITFRAEMYNTFNNVNFSTPGLNIQTPQTFGRISSTTGSPRIMQMALRYDF